MLDHPQEEATLSTKHPSARLLALLAVLAIAAAACGGGTTTAPSTEPSIAPSTEPSTEPDPMAALIAEAQAEGNLTTIALPHDWCNYGEVISTFKSKYNIAVNELSPGVSSGVEIEAIEANKDNPGPQAPDVVGAAFPSLEQLDEATAVIESQWDEIVGAIFE